MTMTAAEFTAARERLGWTAEQAAAEYDLTPSVVAAWERGTVKIPRDVARDLRWRAALEERKAVLDASGLPECPEARTLDQAAAQKEGEELIAGLEALTTHAKACPVCRARSEYMDRHAPPLPEFPMPRSVRVFGAFEALVKRLPAPLRPADGAAGEGRLIALGIAALLSAFVVAMLVLVGASRLATHGWEADWWGASLTILAAVIPGYFIGFYLAGAAFDATRRVRHRPVGYVARGALAMGAIYGTIGLIMPLIDAESRFADVPIFAGGFAVLGAVVGGVLWVRDRLRGKLPKPATCR